jgi:hypothetical protein
VPYTDPNVDEFKDYFDRDFPYGSSIDYVRDQDVEKAIAKTILMINQALAPDQAFYTQIFLLLSAHNMVMSLRVSAQGVGSQPEWLRVGKSAGSVSESFQIPERFAQNPQLALLQRTGYGQEYLELILPNLIGQISWVPGRTLP